MYAFINATIYAPELLKDRILLIKDNLIHKTLSDIQQIPAGYEIIDISGKNIAPGFIDIQLNGCGGVSFNNHTEFNLDILKKMQETNQQYGCTSFLPTLITDSFTNMQNALAVVKEYMEIANNEVLGIHFEGPYISKIKSGTHNKSLMRKLNQIEVNWFKENQEWIKIITLAPEVNDLEFIKELAQTKIKISVGHSNASYEQTITAINNGVSLATHLYNAMSGISAREPGVIGAILDTECYAGFIPDGMHVNWANLRTALKLKPEHMVIVTDAVTPAGTDLKTFFFADKEILVKNVSGTNICVDENGVLSGAAITMDVAIKNVIKHCNLPLEQGIYMATLAPARAIGVESRLGSISAKKIANLVVFDDNLKIYQTWSAGKLVYKE